jgi:hypothetical protein
VREGLVTALKESTILLGGDVSLEAVENLSAASQADMQAAVKTLNAVISRIGEVTRTVKKAPRSVRLATANQTRWHSSLYASFVFVAQYLDEVADYFTALPPTSRSASANEIVELLHDGRARDLIRAELSSYVESLDAAAAFLNEVSEVSVAKPMAAKLTSVLYALKSNLHKQPAESAGRHLYDAIVAKQDDTNIRQTLETFWVIQFFEPGGTAHYTQDYRAWRQSGQASGRNVRLLFGFTEQEFAETTWDHWLDRRTSIHLEDGQTAQDFWATCTEFAALRRPALYLLSLPVSVTSCDSVISVLGNAFTSRQNHLSVANAGALIAFKCNGDFARASIDPSAFPAWAGGK